MAMGAIRHWLAMGGYAFYVWSAYGMMAAVLGGLAFFCWRRHRQSGAELARLTTPPAGRRE
ncbi:MAG TPA: heme exporter protein CcmD [Stellaceae bacterium]|nr:heme exporter protein CcmD [Stellaceae bacterium]